MENNQRLDVMITIGVFLSSLACLSIIISFVSFKQLRNLFYRISLYHAIVELIQVLGLGSSCWLSTEQYCKYYASIRVYGAMGSIVFSLIQQHQILKALNKCKNPSAERLIGNEYTYFKSFEKVYLFLGFLLPLLCALIPLWFGEITNNADICYISVQPGDQRSKVEIISVSVLIWEGPLLVYVVYSLWVVRQIKTIFSEYEDQLKNSMQSLIKQLYLNLAITLFCTIPFTISDILQMYQIQQSWFIDYSLFVLSLWGLLDSLNLWLTNIDMQYKFQVCFGIKEDSILYYSLQDKSLILQLQDYDRQEVQDRGSSTGTDYYFQGADDDYHVQNNRQTLL